MERERLSIYEEIRSKPKLSPLVELIEPTSHWKRTEDNGEIQIMNCSNGHRKKELNRQNVLEKFEEKYQQAALIASTESLTEKKEIRIENGGTAIIRKKKNINEKKLRFNPYDEFSD